jgi:hypothetical protein
VSGREWKPGDVAVVRNEYGVWNRAICTVGPSGDTWRFGVAPTEQPVKGSEAHPLVVIDPEDAAALDALARAWDEAESCDLDNEQPMTMRALRMRVALRSLITPPEVFEHYPASSDASVAVALCGKVWRPDPDATSMGRCPECTSIVEAGWVR